MNYPVWFLPNTGGGLLIAIIAILHVVISHLAVGGGLFLVLTERKAVLTKDSALLEYVRKHTWFFLLLTMVFGGMSGVGIWFIIALVNPAATSITDPHFCFWMGHRMGLFYRGDRGTADLPLSLWQDGP